MIVRECNPERSARQGSLEACPCNQSMLLSPSINMFGYLKKYLASGGSFGVRHAHPAYPKA